MGTHSLHKGNAAAFSYPLREKPENDRKKGGENMETFDPNKKPKLKKITGLLKKSGVIAVLVIAIPVIGIGSVYNIQEQEQAVLTTLGSAKTVAEPGLHFKIPFIQRVQKVNTTIQGVAIGYGGSGEGRVCVSGPIRHFAEYQQKLYSYRHRKLRCGFGADDREK